jgi:DNA repair photolyase
MGLNVSRENMYKFVSHTWNTVKGYCYHDCSYCFTKRSGKKSFIKFDYNELYTDLEKGHFIFVGSGNDLFAKDIPKKWIEMTIEYCNKFNNRYFFQSKNPERFLEFTLPDKSVVCTTIETNRWYPDIMNNAPRPELRAEAMSRISLPKYVTIEPILDFDLDELVALIRECKPIQVNIGADSGDNNLPEPDKTKISQLIQKLKKFTVVHRKYNLTRLMC